VSHIAQDTLSNVDKSKLVGGRERLFHLAQTFQ
jgi:hypothetical protein